MKRLLILLALLFTLATPSAVLAQTFDIEFKYELIPTEGANNSIVKNQATMGSVSSNTTCTEVGEAGEGQTCIATASGKLADVVEWNTKINTALEPAVWGYFNKLTTRISNGDYTTAFRRALSAGVYNEDGIYWCTYSIVDAYNLAGIKGMSVGAQGSVFNMRRYFKSTPGYVQIDYEGNEQQVMQQVKPGMAIFMQSVNDTHTGSEHVAMVLNVSVDNRGNGFLETMDSNSTRKVQRYPVSSWRVQTFYPTRGFGGINEGTTPGGSEAPVQ